MKKSESIRDIVAKYGLGLTNREIQSRVLEEHRLHCTGQQIIAIVGPYHERMAVAGFSSDLLQAARKYISLVGSLPLAKKILEVAEVR